MIHSIPCNGELSSTDDFLDPELLIKLDTKTEGRAPVGALLDVRKGSIRPLGGEEFQRDYSIGVFKGQWGFAGQNCFYDLRGKLLVTAPLGQRISFGPGQHLGLSPCLQTPDGAWEDLETRERTPERLTHPLRGRGYGSDDKGELHVNPVHRASCATAAFVEVGEDQKELQVEFSSNKGTGAFSIDLFGPAAHWAAHLYPGPEHLFVQTFNADKPGDSSWVRHNYATGATDRLLSKGAGADPLVSFEQDGILYQLDKRFALRRLDIQRGWGGVRSGEDPPKGVRLYGSGGWLLSQLPKSPVLSKAEGFNPLQVCHVTDFYPVLGPAFGLKPAPAAPPVELTIDF